LDGTGKLDLVQSLLKELAMLDLLPTQLRWAVPSERSPRVAVVLNGNAKAVTEQVIRQLGEVLNGESVFVSKSTEQSRFIARALLHRHYDVVFCGGGDGTFSQVVSDVLALAPARLPRFGVLRLGTGNALATSLGASPASSDGLAADLGLALDPQADADLPLVTVEDRVAPFAGFGLDALILEDYNALKGRLRATPLAALGQGGAGYALAIAGRSLWRFILEPLPVVTVRNLGAPTRRMDLRGRPVGPVMRPGDVLYQGPAAIAAVSTIPFYGLGLRLFPQAALRSDRFQLRVGNVDALRLLGDLPALFRGEFDDERVFDYFCTAVSISCERDQALQVGGDQVGRRRELRVRLAQVPVVARQRRGDQLLQPTLRARAQSCSALTSSV
jgi:diacylglycerol kinase family enzyme